MMYKECTKCIHKEVCKTAESCDGYVSGCEHFNPGWISVKERLPEPGKEVLLIAHGWEGRLYYTGCLRRQEAERSWLTGIESKASDWTIWGFSYLREPVVTHWMPLPQPPKGE